MHIRGGPLGRIIILGKSYFVLTNGLGIVAESLKINYAMAGKPSSIRRIRDNLFPINELTFYYDQMGHEFIFMEDEHLIIRIMSNKKFMAYP